MPLAQANTKETKMAQETLAEDVAVEGLVSSSFETYVFS